jgi:hypothetical protein
MANRRNPQRSTLFVLLALLAIISLSCELESEQSEPIQPLPAPVGADFNESDCNDVGISFSDIWVGRAQDENVEGPYLHCELSSDGAHGSIHASLGIETYKADKLEAAYQNQRTTILVNVTSANEWNNQPDMPEDVKYVISTLYDKVDGYVFMITAEANMENCIDGSGYGTMILFDKYLANFQYSSCELADTAAYVAMLNSFEQAAINATMRVESANTNP